MVAGRRGRHWSHHRGGLLVGDVVLVAALVLQVGVRTGDQGIDELRRGVLHGQVEEVMDVGRAGSAQHNLLVGIQHLVGLRLNTRWLLGTKVQLAGHRILAGIVGFALVEYLIGQHIAGGYDVLLAGPVGISRLQGQESRGRLRGSCCRRAEQQQQAEAATASHFDWLEREERRGIRVRVFKCRPSAQAQTHTQTTLHFKDQARPPLLQSFDSGPLPRLWCENCSHLPRLRIPMAASRQFVSEPSSVGCFN